MARDVTVKFSPKTGTFDRFYVFVDGTKEAGFAAEGGEWEGELGPSPSTLKVRVFGQGKAEYMLTVDVPGDANDLSAKRTLVDGYDELTVTT